MMALAIPLAAVIGFFIVWAMKVNSGPTGKQREQQMAEETMLIQEIYQGLEKMEKRIEALEILILDIEKKEQGR